jgi:hypothetical protein
MKRTRLLQGIALIAIALLSMAGVGTVCHAQVLVVNMTPNSQSNEVGNDAEPNLAVNPANPSQIAATAFTPCPTAGSNAPIYVSVDGGNTWNLNCIVPGGNSVFGTGDITIRFPDTSGVLYAGDLRGDSFLEMNILRTSDFTSLTPMTVLEDRFSEDQPYIEAAVVPSGPGAGNDRVYVGNNDFSSTQTATVDLSLNAATPPPPAGFGPHGVETRVTCGQDGPPTRPAVHANGTIYAAFFRWVSGATGCGFGITTITADVVVVRDDNWGSGATPFSALSDVPSPPGDGLVGRRVAIGVPLRWRSDFGSQISLSSQISIAVDPASSQTVWLAWADGASPTNSNYTLHVRRSTDGGQTWSGDLRAVVPATNPALAINRNGKVGFLYQKFVNAGTCASGGSCWETHLERTSDGVTWSDLVLANVSAAPHTAFHRDIGDYLHLMAVGRDFYGVFSADNAPNPANFPNHVSYLRYADFTTHQLFADAAHTIPVPTSIDPFFFHVTEPPAFQYAAKFICGKTDEDEAEHGKGLVADSLYFTTLNLHNPGETTATAKLKFALAAPLGQPGTISPFSDVTLAADQAVEVDCAQIRKLLNITNDHLLDGFSVLESDSHFDLVSVYSAGHHGKLETFGLERVPERKQ